MEYSFIEINDGSDRTITGIIAYDRDNGGRLIIPSGTAFPVTGVLAGELFFRTDEMLLYVRDITNTSWDSSSATPTPHAPTHIEGGTDVIDGDQLEIDYTPANYVRDVTPGEVTTTTQLTAHLAGIDNALAPSMFTDLATVFNTTVQTVTNTYSVGADAQDGLLLRDTLVGNVTVAGVYRLDITYLWNHDAQSNDFIAQVKEGGVVRYFHRQEPKDSLGTGVGGTDQVHTASGFILLNLGVGSFTFEFSFGTSAGAAESTVLQSYLMFYKVS
jgi:hypothetical protein